MRRARAAHLGPQLRRPLVLDAALGLFAHNGYDNVSMQAIADAAGVSKPVLYSCFTSKEELFDELMRREERKLWHLVEDAVPVPGAPGDREEFMCQGLAALLRAVAEAPDTFRFIYVQRHGDNRVEIGRRRWEARMAEVLVAWSELTDREARVTARMLVATAEIGFRVQLEEPAQWEPEVLARFLAATLMRGAIVAHEQA